MEFNTHIAINDTSTIQFRFDLTDLNTRFANTQWTVADVIKPNNNNKLIA